MEENIQKQSEVGADDEASLSAQIDQLTKVVRDAHELVDIKAAQVAELEAQMDGEVIEMV